MSLLKLFCHADAFCQQFDAHWHQFLIATRLRQRREQLSTSKSMTIVIHVHQAHYRDFKAYYLQYGAVQLRPESPHWLATGASWN